MSEPSQRTSPAEDRAARTEGALFAPGELGDYAGFVCRSLRRRWAVALCTFALVAGAVAAALATMPRTYEASVKLLGQPSPQAPGGSRSTGWGEVDGLAQGAAEVALAHEHLVAMVREHGLVERWTQSRAPVPRMVDGVRAWVGALPQGEAEWQEALVRVLERQLTVHVENGVVELRARWPEPHTAALLVESMQRRLLQARHAAELAPLERQVQVLEQQVAGTQQRIDGVLARVQSSIGKRRQGARAATVHGLQAGGSWRNMPDPQLARQRLELMQLRKDIRELEESYRQRRATLKALLAEQQAIYAPAHPVLQESRERLAALEQESSKVGVLKQREQELLARFVSGGGKDGDLSEEPAAAWPKELQEENEEAVYGRSRIGMELNHLGVLLVQVADARVALASAQATFSQRYAVIQPARVPQAPSVPWVPLVALAGVIGALAMAVVAAVAADVRGGQVLERWQMERTLELPVLAEVREP